MSTQISQKIEKFGYRFGEYLGRGSVGFARKAEKDGHEHVIKLVFFLDDQYNSILEIMEKVNSSFLVKFQAHFWEEGNLYMVSEFCPERNLRSIMDTLDSNQAIFIFFQLLKGLNDLHVGKIIHGNLKPENVFVDSKLRVKMSDFGLRTFINTLDPQEVHYTTMAYFSPEVIKKLPLDEKTDVWSLGVLAYEMIMKKLPFSGPPILIPLRVLDYSVKPEPIPEKACHPKFSEVIFRMLERDPENRPTIRNICDSDLRSMATDVDLVNFDRIPCTASSSFATAPATAVTTPTSRASSTSLSFPSSSVQPFSSPSSFSSSSLFFS